MEFGQKPSTSRRFVGLAVVALLHVALIWGLVVGLSRKEVEVAPPPIETKIVEEVVTAEEPPPPPPPPEFDAPPPPFIPPPEISVQPPPRPRENTITTVSKEPTPPPPPAPVRQVVRTEAVVKASRCRPPQYPSISQRLGEEGTVVLQMLVGTDGRVSDSKVERSSGYERLDEAARKALSRCQFDPGTVDGVATASWARIKYTWKIPN